MGTGDLSHSQLRLLYKVDLEALLAALESPRPRHRHIRPRFTLSSHVNNKYTRPQLFWDTQR